MTQILIQKKKKNKMFETYTPQFRSHSNSVCRVSSSAFTHFIRNKRAKLINANAYMIYRGGRRVAGGRRAVFLLCATPCSAKCQMLADCFRDGREICWFGVFLMRSGCCFIWKVFCECMVVVLRERNLGKFHLFVGKTGGKVYVLKIFFWLFNFYFL